MTFPTNVRSYGIPHPAYTMSIDCEIIIDPLNKVNSSSSFPIDESCSDQHRSIVGPDRCRSYIQAATLIAFEFPPASSDSQRSKAVEPQHIKHLPSREVLSPLRIRLGILFPNLKNKIDLSDITLEPLLRKCMFFPLVPKSFQLFRGFADLFCFGLPWYSHIVNHAESRL